MIFDTKKGKYTDEENQIIIDTMNQGLKEGKREREILKELSQQLKRGYAGIMSHVRKLRSEYPDRFHSYDDQGDGNRLNSWSEEEEELVIKTVNQFLEEGKPLSQAIAELESQLSRTQGAIYQRIYTLRRKHPDKFTHLPERRQRRRRKMHDWEPQHASIPSLDEYSARNQSGFDHFSSTAEQQLATAIDHLHTYNKSLFKPIAFNNKDQATSLTNEEEMVIKAFTERYGHLNPESRNKMIDLMRTYGSTRVSIAIFTLAEDKAFPVYILEFLERRLRNHKFL
ncbi:hypothetical protein [Laceyella tengchongensis]|uniref:hypothetical protein n=1 Tax=Laceyella tengchongensis TaxID=574699 RepID=UPI0012B8C6D2|nr:hypothetical protein [Laceyella tengchongensis]